MDGIIRLKHINDFQKVCFYSVVMDQDNQPIETADSLFEQFVREHAESNS